MNQYIVLPLPMRGKKLPKYHNFGQIFTVWGAFVPIPLYQYLDKKWPIFDQKYLHGASEPHTTFTKS